MPRLDFFVGIIIASILVSVFMVPVVQVFVLIGMGIEVSPPVRIDGSSSAPPWQWRWRRQVLSGIVVRMGWRGAPGGGEGVGSRSSRYWHGHGHGHWPSHVEIVGGRDPGAAPHAVRIELVAASASGRLVVRWVRRSWETVGTVPVFELGGSWSMARPGVLSGYRGCAWLGLLVAEVVFHCAQTCHLDEKARTGRGHGRGVSGELGV